MSVPFNLTVPVNCGFASGANIVVISVPLIFNVFALKPVESMVEIIGIYEILVMEPVDNSDELSSYTYIVEKISLKLYYQKSISIYISLGF